METKQKRILRNQINLYGKIGIGLLMALGMIGVLNYLSYQLTPTQMTVFFPDLTSPIANTINITYAQVFPILITTTKPTDICITLIQTNNSDFEYHNCVYSSFWLLNLNGINPISRNIPIPPAGNYILEVFTENDGSNYLLENVIINKAVPILNCTYNGVGIDCVETN